VERVALAAAAVVVAAARVFELVAGSAAGASARLAASSGRWLFASPVADAPYLAAAAGSAVPCPAVRQVCSAAVDISGPALRRRC